MGWEEIFLEGVVAARAGKSFDSCPYHSKDNDFSDHFWRNGFKIILQDETTTIENVFQIVFGGPIRRDTEFGYVKEERFKIPPGDWVRLENYVDEDGSPSEWNSVFQEHLLQDGVYDVTDLPYYHVPGAESLDAWITGEGLTFVEEHGRENIYIATGYQVSGVFLFAGKPKPVQEEQVKGTFARGACCIFENCPKSLLIIGEDD